MKVLDSVQTNHSIMEVSQSLFSMNLIFQSLKFMLVLRLKHVFTNVNTLLLFSQRRKLWNLIIDFMFIFISKADRTRFVHS